LARKLGALDECFFVLYGDSYLPVQFTPILEAFHSSHQPALMTVLRNEGRWDRSNVQYESGRIALYDKAGAPGMQYIDYGLSCFRREVFDGAGPADLSALFHALSLENRLAGFEVDERFYEIGSPEGLRDLELYLNAREPVHFSR
jgi:NDP-sugar pyrophosphorylase family protein